MLTIRFQRVGKKKQPVFRIVLAEKHRAASKLAKEVLGHYNPRTKEFGVRNEERLKYWIAQRIEISPTVHNLLLEKGFLSGKKIKSWRPKPKAPEVKAEAQKPAEPTAETPAAATQEQKPADEPKVEAAS